MLPTEWREMLEVLVGNFPTVATKMLYSLFDVNRVPNSNGRYNEIECASPILLVLSTAIIDASQSINTNGTREGIACFPFEECLMHLLP